MKVERLIGSTCLRAHKVLCASLKNTLLFVSLLCLFPVASSAAGFQLGSSDSFDLGAGSLDLQCGDFVLNSGSVFHAGSGEIFLSGNWDNQGAFDRGGSKVVFNDACGDATVSQVFGETYFHSLAAVTNSSHELHFPAGLTQSVANSLVFKGAEDHLLSLRSSTLGKPAILMLERGGSQVISYVDVKDNHAFHVGQWLAMGEPQVFNSVDSGGNSRWFHIGMFPVPTLSLWGTLLLVLSLAAVYVRRKRTLMRS